MSGPNQPNTAALPVPPAGGAAAVPQRKGRRYSVLTRGDRVTMALMVGIPTFLCISFIWLPTLASIGLSFTNWRGITPITANNIVGFKNYEVLFTQYTLFWKMMPTATRVNAGLSRLARCAGEFSSASMAPVSDEL